MQGVNEIFLSEPRGEKREKIGGIVTPPRNPDIKKPSQRLGFKEWSQGDSNS